MSEVDLSDPVKGLKWVEKHVGETEMLMTLEKAKDDPDSRVLSRLEYSLLKWGELAQHYQYQMFQQGKTSEDITKHSKKVRANAGTG